MRSKIWLECKHDVIMEGGKPYDKPVFLEGKHYKVIGVTQEVPARDFSFHWIVTDEHTHEHRIYWPSHPWFEANFKVV